MWADLVFKNMVNIPPYTAYKSCWFESSNDLFLTEITGLNILFFNFLKKESI